MNQLEKDICNVYERKYGVYTGNGTTAMYLIFLALNNQNKKVIFPAISCTNPVNAAIYAGYKVDFCDVNLDNYTMDISYLENMLKTGEYGIIVPTHIYGNICDISAILQLSRKYNVIVLEDAAQTFKLYGDDIAITSFGHTKLFETDEGGGIAFTNNRKLYEEINSKKKLLKVLNSKDAEILYDKYRSEYYRIANGNNTEEEKNIKMKELQLKSKDIFIYHNSDNAEILLKLSMRNNILQSRRESQQLYIKLLDKKYIELPNLTYDDEGLWRFSFIYNKDRKKLLEKVRSYGIDISSWYPSLAQIYKNQILKNADIVSKRIVNLWISQEHSKEQIMDEIAIINNCMEE